MENSDLIQVEVAFALPHRQEIISLDVKKGCSALEAVHRSNIAAHFPEMDLAHARMGIFSTPMDGRSLPLPQDYHLEAGDRVEIYRPLLMDPKQARLLRATRARERRSASSTPKRPTPGSSTG